MSSNCQLIRNDGTYRVPGTLGLHPVWGTSSVRLFLPCSKLLACHADNSRWMQRHR